MASTNAVHISGYVEVEPNNQEGFITVSYDDLTYTREFHGDTNVQIGFKTNPGKVNPVELIKYLTVSFNPISPGTYVPLKVKQVVLGSGDVIKTYRAQNSELNLGKSVTVYACQPNNMVFDFNQLSM